MADAGRTEKTICLAVSPSLKSYGIPGRARLFEVVQRVREVNRDRARRLGSGGHFTGESVFAPELEENPCLKVGYIAAPPRMAYYMEYSTRIYQIYLRYIAPEDIHVYSIDEVMIDITEYVRMYKLTARELTTKLIHEIKSETGITAAAGIGTNLYLCKVAMDIVAKHAHPDEEGVRIAQLDELCYRRLLWGHTPLTDFWRIGRGYTKKLNEYGMYTMGDVARCSIGKKDEYYNEDLLYKLFGVNAELLIDHAWGYEPCTMADIKSYRSETNSVSEGQVLSCPYTADKARLIVKEMTDGLVLGLVDKHLVTNQLVLTIGYDVENLTNPEIAKKYKGEIVLDGYGRRIPKHAHGTQNLAHRTSSTKLIIDAMMELFDRIINRNLLVRRINVVACKVVDESLADDEPEFTQLDLFTDYEKLEREKEQEKKQLAKERQMQQAVLDIKKKFGKNAILKGMNLEDGATAISRNGQIGGHRA